LEERKYYPLSPAQLLNFMSWKYTFHKQIMNIPTSFLIEKPLDLAILKKAVEEAVQRNDSFAIRITKDGKETRQYFTDRELLLLETKDFSGKTVEEMNDFFNRIGRKKVSLYEQPLAKVYIIQSPEGFCGIYSCVCHLMMDTWAISMFYKDIMSIYHALTDNAPMPAPIRSCESVIQKEIEYKTSPQYEKGLEFWREEVKGDGTLPTFTHVNGQGMLESYRRLIRKPDHPFARTFFMRTTARHEVLQVNKADVDIMKDFCIGHNIPTMQPLLFLGLRTYLSRVNNRAKDVSITDVVARRGTLEEKFSGGTRPQGLVCRTYMDEDITFMDALDFLIQKHNTLYRHADTFMMDIFDIIYSTYGMKSYEGYSTTLFTFQPIPLDFGSGMKSHSQWYCNGAAASSLYIMVMDGDEEGSLRCYYEYMDKIIQVETLKKCHNFMLAVIRAGIANPSITLKELLELPLVNAK